MTAVPEAGKADPPAAARLPDSLVLAEWQRLWAVLGITDAPVPVHARLLQHYAQPHRAYHTLQHLDECLRVRRQYGVECDCPAEVELALWFHDAVYQPLRKDNERLSASWLDDVAREAGLGGEVRDRLKALVMVTRHEGSPATRDQAVLVDTDLAILGATAERFDEYDGQVRREYRHVPEFVYRRRRRQVLQGFLSRTRLFATDACFDAFEQQARVNLARAIARLE